MPLHSQVLRQLSVHNAVSGDTSQLWLLMLQLRAQQANSAAL